MKNTTKAYAPGNVSCLFKIFPHKNPRWRGSYGLGFTINKGVTSEVELSSNGRTEIYFNDKLINFAPVNKIANKLTAKPLTIKLDSPLPLGCGFGVSGASSLSTAYAINKLLKLGKTNRQLAIIAHTAEVESGTGLGDVVNQYYGGCQVKLVPSSRFESHVFDLDKTPVWCAYFSKIPTATIINDEKLKKQINDAGDEALKSVKTLIGQNKKIDFKEIIRISKKFAEDSGLLKDERTIQTIKQIENSGGKASMIILGNAVFSDKPFKGSGRFLISNSGAQLLE